jgi:hypothetical protein
MDLDKLRELPKKPPKELTKRPLRQIRQFCLECVGGSVAEVASCTGVKCPLWEMRFGRHVDTQRSKDPDSLDREKVLARFR